MNSLFAGISNFVLSYLTLGHAILHIGQEHLILFQCVEEDGLFRDLVGRKISKFNSRGIQETHFDENNTSLTRRRLNYHAPNNYVRLSCGCGSTGIMLEGPGDDNRS